MRWFRGLGFRPGVRGWVARAAAIVGVLVVLGVTVAGPLVGPVVLGGQVTVERVVQVGPGPLDVRVQVEACGSPMRPVAGASTLCRSRVQVATVVGWAVLAVGVCTWAAMGWSWWTQHRRGRRRPSAAARAAGRLGQPPSPSGSVRGVTR